MQCQISSREKLITLTVQCFIIRSFMHLLSETSPDPSAVLYDVLWPVCRSVSLYVRHIDEPYGTAEPIEMSFGTCTRGTNEPCIPDLPREGGF